MPEAAREIEQFLFQEARLLDQRAVEPLLLVAELHQLESRGDLHLARSLFGHDVADLVHRPRERLARMRARMARLLHAQLEQGAVVVDDRGGLERLALVLFQRNPVGGVVGEELEPRLELLRVEQPRLVIQELLRAHFAYGADM